MQDSKGIVTDFLSFYHLPSTVINNDKHDKLFAMYSFYNACTSISFMDLMSDALILAKKDGADVFNALTCNENEPTFLPLKFGEGDGFLQFYLYNWKCPWIESREIGLVLV